MKLTAIKQIADNKIVLTWHDGHISVFALNDLRNACPCASCKGEQVLLHHYAPMPQVDLPEKNNLKNISTVGAYAIQLFWGDGHDTGLYSFEYLRSLCECELCKSKIN